MAGVGLTFGVAALLGIGVVTKASLDAGTEAQIGRLVTEQSRRAYGAIHAANDYVATGAPEDRRLFDESMAELRASLGTMVELNPAHQASAASLRVAADHMEEAAQAIWGGDTHEARLAAMRDFDVSGEQAIVLLEALDQTMTIGVQDRQQTETAALAGAWALALVLVGALLLRCDRDRRKALSSARELDASVLATAAAVDALGADQPPPELPDNATVAPIKEAITRLAEVVSSLRARAASSRRWADTTGQIEQLLDLAESEAAVLRTIERTAQFVFPDAEPQVLLADNSHAHLKPRLSNKPQPCAPPSPMQCPALRRSTTIDNPARPSLGRCPHLADEFDGPVTCACVAINGRNTGALQLIGAPPIEEMRDLMRHLSTTAGNRLSVVRVLEERELQASTDPLTGLANRRQMNQRLADLEGQREEFAVVSCDLDHFKRLNDTFGHDVGDRCLKIFAQALRSSCREVDLPCRPGGEEFLVVLPNSSIDAAAAVAERIRTATLELSRHAGVEFTVSLGVAAWPLHGTDAEVVLRAADEALYRSKEDGRNRVSRPKALIAAA